MDDVVGDDGAVAACVEAVADGAGGVEPGVGDCYCCVGAVGVDVCCAVVDGYVDVVECCG